MLLRLLMVFPYPVQAWLSYWLSACLADPYQAMLYDNALQEQLQQSGLTFDAYTTVPLFDYCDPSSPVWSVLVCSEGKWRSIAIPNPYYLSQAVVKEPSPCNHSQPADPPHFIENKVTGSIPLH